MLSKILSSIICSAFEQEVGRRRFSDKVFRLNFQTRTDYDKEEGYRGVELLLYAPNNYVQVWEREWWNVLPADDLYYDEEEGETYIKKDSPGYRKGESEWSLKSCHDSCWRQDGVDRFIMENEDQMLLLDSAFSPCGSWYQIETFDPEKHPTKKTRQRPLP